MCHKGQIPPTPIFQRGESFYKGLAEAGWLKLAKFTLDYLHGTVEPSGMALLSLLRKVDFRLWISPSCIQFLPISDKWLDTEIKYVLAITCFAQGPFLS